MSNLMRREKGQTGGKRPLKKRIRESLPYYIMLLPGLIILVIFCYFPLYGWKIAFEKFIPAKGFFGNQQNVGLHWFKYLLNYPNFNQAFRNTLVISVEKLILMTLVSIAFSILLNEIYSRKLKSTLQTIVYLPHFLSWIILAGVLVDILSPSSGVVNKMITACGGKPIFFLGSNDYFQGTVVITDVWKEFGFNSIVYLAAITSIDQSLYEAAVVDGASRWKQTWHVTLPGMMPIIMLMLLLNIGGVMNANFDQIYNLYSPVVYATGDVLDTLVYRVGLIQMNFSLSTAISIFKSVISLILVGGSYLAAYKFTDYQIF